MYVYTLPGGAEIAPGQSFALSYQLVPDNEASRDTVQFPANWLANATLEDLNRVGITRTTVEDPAPVPPTHQELLDYAAEKRRELANGSTTVNVGTRSIPTWADPESRGSISGLVLALTFSPDLTAPWKGADGAFYTLTAAEIPPLALGMMAYVQTCFAAEAQVDNDITGNVTTTFQAIDTAFAALVPQS